MTNHRFRDSDVRRLGEISQSLHDDYPGDDDFWKESPFAWIRKEPSRRVGAIGEKLVEKFLAAKDFNVFKSPDSDADRVIDGIGRTEIKFSTLWKSRLYKFQQIRNQRYDVLICLGVGPFDAHCWALPKRTVETNWGTKRLPYQHAGKTGRDTVWLSVDPASVPDWLRPYGGTLADAVRIIRKMRDPSHHDQAGPARR